MFFLMQKILECSMRLGRRRNRLFRLLGKILAVYPEWYAERMEKKLMKGVWNPAEKWRKRQIRHIRRKRKVSGKKPGGRRQSKRNRR